MIDDKTAPSAPVAEPIRCLWRGCPLTLGHRGRHQPTMPPRFDPEDDPRLA